MPGELSLTERQFIKQALQYLILISRGERVQMVALLSSHNFEKDVITSLKKSCTWTKEDDQKIAALSREVLAPKYDTAGERCQLLLNILASSVIKDQFGIRLPLYHLKISQTFGHVGFKAFFESPMLKQTVIEPLQKIYGWTEQDDNEIADLAAEFNRETNGKSMVDKRSRLTKILALTGAAAGVGLVAAFLIYLNRRK